MVKKNVKNHFNQLKANEEELNRIFLLIFTDCRDELTPEVEDKRCYGS